MSDKESLFKVMLIDYINNQFEQMMKEIDSAVNAAAVEDCWDKDQQSYLLIKAAALALFENQVAGIINAGSHSKRIRKDANNIRRIM